MWYTNETLFLYISLIIRNSQNIETIMYNMEEEEEEEEEEDDDDHDDNRAEDDNFVDDDCGDDFDTYQ